jgi:hypothetical protein
MDSKFRGAVRDASAQAQRAQHRDARTSDQQLNSDIASALHLHQILPQIQVKWNMM